MRTSKAESQYLAIKQHAAVSQFLNRASIKGQLTESLSDSNERILLIRLLQAHHPVKYEKDKHLQDEFNTPSSFSTVVKRLNEFLEKFSDQFDALRKNNIRITIPTKVGGLQLGKYLTCQDMATLEYLDDISIKEVLLQAWVEFKEKQKRETAAKKQTTRLSAEKPHIRYLRRIEQVLRVGMPEEPKWFRKTGPIAVDFDDGRVYRREKTLNDLKNLVMNNSVSMLEGLGATGKTVLVLNLAYDMYKAGEKRIYYFDCDKDRDFDNSRLISEIKSIEGVIILENLHLAPQKFQSVYYELKHNRDRHILFVSRSSFREFQYSRSEDLTQIEALKLAPFDEVEAIIENFNAHSGTAEIPMKVAEQIKEVSSDNLWLLSYALDGYAKSNGEGKPSNWLEAGVKEDLRDLKNINKSYPEVLVALSPLYLNEVLTAESFLLGNLGIDYEVLGQLVKRGEITCQITEDGHVFYGLPHSALADAYWEHGQEYRERRRLPEYEDFIYEYITSNVPNALEAITATEGDVQCQLSRRLQNEGRLVPLIERERRGDMIRNFLYNVDKRVLSERKILICVARKIEEEDDMWDVPFYFLAVIKNCGYGTAQQLIDLLDYRKFAAKVVKSRGTGTVLIGLMTLGDKRLVSQICGLLDKSQLVAEINRDEDVGRIGLELSQIIFANRAVGRAVWQAIDKESLAMKLSRPNDFWRAQCFVNNLRLSNAVMARGICGLLSIEKLTAILNESDDYCNAVQYSCEIWRANPKVGQRLWRGIDKKKLASKVGHRVVETYICIDNMWQTDRNMAFRFCSLLDAHRLAQMLKATREGFLRDYCLAAIRRAHVGKARQILRLMAIKEDRQ